MTTAGSVSDGSSGTRFKWNHINPHTCSSQHNLTSPNNSKNN